MDHFDGVMSLDMEVFILIDEEGIFSGDAVRLFAVGIECGILFRDHFNIMEGK